MSANKITFSFLNLAPIQSASFPMSPTSRPAVTKGGPQKAVQGSAGSLPAINSPPENLAGPSAEEIALALKSTRSGSTSTADSESLEKNRFLKLGPVHWGGTPGASDWADE